MRACASVCVCCACVQLHGVLKADLKHVIATIMEVGSTTIGGCGDINRNIMCTPAPIDAPEYKYAREWQAILAELFVPQTTAFSEVISGARNGTRDSTPRRRHCHPFLWFETRATARSPARRHRASVWWFSSRGCTAR